MQAIFGFAEGRAAGGRLEHVRVEETENNFFERFRREG
jgi:hypothetical protein